MRVRLLCLFRCQGLHRNQLVGLLLGVRRVRLDQRLVNVWQYTTARDCCLDCRVQLLISSDSKLQMSRVDALEASISACIACQLQDLCAQVLEDSSGEDGCFAADPRAGWLLCLQIPMHTTDRKLEASLVVLGNRLVLARGRLDFAAAARSTIRHCLLAVDVLFFS